MPARIATGTNHVTRMPSATSAPSSEAGTAIESLHEGRYRARAARCLREINRAAACTTLPFFAIQMIQIVGFIALAVAIVVVSVAVFVGIRAREAVPNGNAPVYRVRKYYAAVLVGVLLVSLVLTLPYAPYDAYAGVEPAARVLVTGRMWSWELKPEGATSTAAVVLPAGKPIDFDVTGADVTHAFGVYNDEGHLIGQTQAMPGYHNHLRMAFDAGRYHVLCVEYCGLVHHTMITEFTVR